MRAALLPTGVDPFHVAYWLRHFRTWAGEVDRLHIAACGPAEDAVIDYLAAQSEKVGATFVHVPERTDHGTVLRRLYDQADADEIVFCEDDAFLCRPGVVRDAFETIRSGVDVVGCPRDGYGQPDLVAALTAKLGGLGFWPTFFFSTKQVLDRTDGNFSAKWWPAGETIAGFTTREETAVDTFVWASIQLRQMGLRIESRDGYRVMANCAFDDPPWFHVGSLSGGHGHDFMGALTAEEYAHQLRSAQTMTADIAKRISWWQRMWDRWDGALPEYHERYGAALETYRSDAGIGVGAVADWRMAFDHLVTWPE